MHHRCFATQPRYVYGQEERKSHAGKGDKQMAAVCMIKFLKIFFGMSSDDRSVVLS